MYVQPCSMDVDELRNFASVIGGASSSSMQAGSHKVIVLTLHQGSSLRTAFDIPRLDDGLPRVPSQNGSGSPSIE